MTSRQPLVTILGFTHASRVIPVDRCSAALSGMVMIVLAPLNVTAPPYLPDVVHEPFAIAPPFPFPVKSFNAVPEPSLNPKAARRWGLVARVVALATLVYGPR